MRWLWPDSIAGRVILVLLVGLTVSHLVSMSSYHTDVAAQVDATSEAQLAERIASISQAVSQAPPREREKAAHALSGPSLDVHWSMMSFVGHPTVPDERLAQLQDMLRQALAGGSNRAVQIAYADESFDALHAHGARHDLLASVQLPDDSWANFRSSVAAAHHSGGSMHVLSSTTLMAVGIVLVSIVCVRWLTAPLRSLAEAAQRLGVDVDAKPMAESGPREVRQAARAFNDMQARLRNLVTNRTQTLAAISHDLRTPITRLRLRAEFVEDLEERRKMMADLDEMEVMISSALAFLRGDAEREEPRLIDIASVLATVCAELADSGQQVDCGDAGPLPLTGRTVALKRAFSNVIGNAVKYGSRARVSSRREGASIVVDIEDEGPGIPVAEHERVFEPFFRLEQSRSRETGGTGLGLTVARTIIFAHGGTIALENLAPRGLRVSIRLPTLPARQ